MAEAEKKAVAQKGTQDSLVFLPLIAGWLVPGAGHFLLRKWGRGALLAISIVCMFALGLAMRGRLYANAHDILEILGLLGDLGSGLLYIAGRAMGLGSDFTAVLLFSLFASTVFGITQRETPPRMFRYGLYCFVLFVGSAIVLSWVMFLIAR